MTGSTITQGSPEWLKMRLGKLTASKCALALTRTKAGWTSTRENTAVEMACERLTGNPIEMAVTGPMQWGIDTEPMARAAYEKRKGVKANEVLFIPHPHIEWAGASPDGVIYLELGGDGRKYRRQGLVEIKCPNSTTHLKTLSGTPVAKKYIMQMDWQMACTGAEWVDFVSFDPRMPENLQLFIKRFERNEDRLEVLEHDAREFLAEVEEKVNALLRLGNNG